MKTQGHEAPLVPVRMLAEFVYCPRLMYLEWVESSWEESPDTVQGRKAHKTVHRERPHAAPVDPDAPATVSSLDLSAPELGLSGRLDLLELGEGAAVPVEYKVGRPSREGPWDTDVMQVAAQALLLRANGWRCGEGVIYYAATRERVRVPVTDDLLAKVMTTRDAMLRAAARPAPPPPLVDSPKCPRCSLVGVCLPDETAALQGTDGTPAPPGSGSRTRRLVVGQSDRKPLYLATQGSLVRKAGDRLRVSLDGEVLGEVRLQDVSSVAVFGQVEVTTPTQTALMREGVPLVFFTYGGWLRGFTSAAMAVNAPMRLAQYRASLDAGARLRASRAVVAAKIHNQRVVLRRTTADSPSLDQLRRVEKKVLEAGDEAVLLGLEGNASRIYFQAYGELLRAHGAAFDMSGRNRRPPKDVPNALLSYAYALLVQRALAAVYTVGLDPYVGLFHHAGYGKPAFALDVMEPYRPIIADSAVLGLVGRRMVADSDFVQVAAGVAMKDAARQRLIEAFESRMDALFEHPVFGYRVSYRRALEIDVRLFGRYIQGELPQPVPLRSR